MPLVKLTVTDVVFNSTISLTQFNVTVQNSASSATYVDVTEITVSVNETIEHARVTNQELPYMLDPNSTVTFMCEWNWTAYQDMSVVITAHTLQRFEISSATEIPEG